MALPLCQGEVHHSGLRGRADAALQSASSEERTGREEDNDMHTVAYNHTLQLC